MKLLETALMKHASMMPELHKPIQNLNNAYRCINIDKGLNMWFGYIYTKNGSHRHIEDDWNLKLTGMEVFGKANNNGVLTDRVERGSESIIILRRTDGNCGISMQNKIHIL